MADEYSINAKITADTTQFKKGVKTVAVVNAKLLANLLAKPAAVLQTSNVKTQRKANNSNCLNKYRPNGRYFYSEKENL